MLGLQAPPRATHAGSSSGSVVKTASEALAAMILNFDSLNGSQARWPCLQRQLLSSQPERIAACRGPFPKARARLPGSRK